MCRLANLSLAVPSFSSLCFADLLALTSGGQALEGHHYLQSSYIQVWKTGECSHAIQTLKVEVHFRVWLPSRITCIFSLSQAVLHTQISMQMCKLICCKGTNSLMRFGLASPATLYPRVLCIGKLPHGKMPIFTQKDQFTLGSNVNSYLNFRDYSFA